MRLLKAVTNSKRTMIFQQDGVRQNLQLLWLIFLKNLFSNNIFRRVFIKYTKYSGKKWTKIRQFVILCFGQDFLSAISKILTLSPFSRRFLTIINNIRDFFQKRTKSCFILFVRRRIWCSKPPNLRNIQKSHHKEF